MKLMRDARTLKEKAVASLKIAMSTFNSYEEDGRITSVLLHLQHACEMLLKAVLVQGKAPVFDKATGKSLGFERCLRLCQSDHGLKPEEAGIMRAVDAMRDASQHWFIFVSEDLLYMHTRAVILAFDEYLKRGLCCTNRVRDSRRESSVVAAEHEQTHTHSLQDQKLAGV